MGSFLSQPLEPVKFVAPPEATSTAKPTQVTAPGVPASPAQAPLFNNCWSCRVLSGSGLIGAGGHCLLGCGHPVRPQREGLPHWMKVPPVNLSSFHVPVTHRGRMALIGVLDRNADIDRLQSGRYDMTEKTNRDCHSWAMTVYGILRRFHRDQ
ncbi:distal membrane-arm assembly complex protein 1 isoform X1 [Bubalus bubalis]|uniref:distal membrane-arm assembly complex protein 1 isoform X1 n=1 Tax=Bubalus bubalis TaxID=89462 RepID=UPI000DBC99E5|nr:distal membrane-arm assembly complex protein 1 isoform X1 [Bubalus bubalis]